MARFAVRVILADDVADDAGGFAGRSCSSRRRARAHAVEDAAVHGLQPVAHVGQRTRHDHAHGVIEIGPLQLALDGNGADIAAVRRPALGPSRYRRSDCFRQSIAKLNVHCRRRISSAGISTWTAIRKRNSESQQITAACERHFRSGTSRRISAITKSMSIGVHAPSAVFRGAIEIAHRDADDGARSPHRQPDRRKSPRLLRRHR